MFEGFSALYGFDNYSFLFPIFISPQSLIPMKSFYYLIGACFLTIASCTADTKKNKGFYTEPWVDSLGKPVKLRVDTSIMVNDTFFINRTTDSRGQVLHAIYIDPNKDSHTHDWIFDWSENDKPNLKYYLSHLKKGKHALSHVNIGNFPTDWRPVYRYRGKYYLYDPNDGANNGTIKVTDSLFIPFYFGDGYTPIAMKSFTRNSDKWFAIRTTHYPEIYDTALDDVNIYTIDNKTGLSVWIVNGDAELMVPKQGVNNYPVIVNHSINRKYDELDFDKIDPKNLITK